MDFAKRSYPLILFFILVSALSQQLFCVQATRVLPGELAGANHLETYSSVYEKTKNSMACWLGRLASGPSPRGPGH
ncbi:hypothetical protein Peur_071242 [Populus x canadensis]|jgi:hypothetical protein